MISFDSGFIDQDKILNYSSHRAKLISKGKGSSFIDAVKKMDEYISDPVVGIHAHSFENKTLK